MRGPPSGGSGGEGGHVFIVSDPRVGSLGDVQRNVKGKNGGHGKGDHTKGRRGDKTVVRVLPLTLSLPCPASL